MTSPRLGGGLRKPAGLFYLFNAVFILPKCKYITFLNKFVYLRYHAIASLSILLSTCEPDWVTLVGILWLLMNCGVS